MRVTDRIENHNFFVRKPDPLTGKTVLYATPLFLVLVAAAAATLTVRSDTL